MVGSECGAIGVPMALLLVTALAFGMGSWGVLRDWRKLAQTQLRLDRCAGETTQDLKRTFERVQSLNQAILAARATLAATAVLPAAAATARGLLQAAYAAQELVLVSWNGKRAWWIARGSCGDAGDLADPLPPLPWVRDPPDSLGPRPMRWAGQSSTFRVQVRHRSRAAAAKIQAQEGTPDGTEPKHWHLEWTLPL